MTSVTVDNIDDLVRALESTNHAPWIICVDGFSGAGKTCTSHKIGAAFSFGVVDVDEFIVKEKDRYFDVIKFDKLRKAIDAFERKPVVVCGVLIRKVAQQIGIMSKTNVYIKKMSGMDIWYGANWLQEYKNDPTMNCSPFDKEVYEYHLEWLPHERADIVFQRPKSSAPCRGHEPSAQ